MTVDYNWQIILFAVWFILINIEYAPDITMLSESLVTTAWRVHGLRMEERPPAVEGSCEYIE
jgi:hypothetical protein